MLGVGWYSLDVINSDWCMVEVFFKVIKEGERWIGIGSLRLENIGEGSIDVLGII